MRQTPNNRGSLHATYSIMSTLSQSACPDNHLFLKNHKQSFSPCGHIHFETWLHGTIQNLHWQIIVHKTFMINISISEAFVPYTDNCEGENVVVREGHGGELIAHFCGHISKEFVYTKRNEALLFVDLKSMYGFMPPLSPRLEASYQIHALGSAYRFTNPCTRNQSAEKIIFHKLPSVAVYHSKHLYYFWYLANSIYIDYMPLLGAMQVTVSALQCEFESTSLSLHPGILTWYRAIHQLPPLHKLACNGTVPNIIEIDHHMYATLTLTQFYLDFSLKVNITFGEVKHYTQHIYIGKKGRLSDRSEGIRTWKSRAPSSLQTVYFDTKHASLSIKSFKYTGSLHSVPSRSMITAEEVAEGKPAYARSTTAKGMLIFNAVFKCHFL